MMKLPTLILALVAACWNFASMTSAFCPAPPLHTPASKKAGGFALNVQSQQYVTEVVMGGEDDDRVLDVASFRNGVINPAMMVERAQAKRDAVDNTAAAVDGLKIGLLYIGPALGFFTYLETQDPIQAAQNYGE
jgi:hypothetical protein